MKVSGTILPRYCNHPKTKVVEWVGQASRLPWKNQASQARRLRYTGRTPSYTSWLKVTELRGFHINPNKIWNGLTGCAGNTGRINESKKMDQNTISFAIMHSSSVTSAVNYSCIWQIK